MASPMSLVKRGTRQAGRTVPVAVGAGVGVAAAATVTGFARSFTGPGLLGTYLAPVVGAVVGGGVGNAVVGKVYKKAKGGPWVGAVLYAGMDLLGNLLGFKLPGFGLIVADQGTGVILATEGGLEGAAGEHMAYVNEGGFGAGVSVNEGGFGGAFGNPFSLQRGVGF